ncbi:hypothetical protein BDQ17DRAFT_1242457 [Cyathus striatus]|nr:hypothetical protein BDQ17DRAFT_1263214 [Cyathus striatus]KAF9002909.1 hypothetical protein BDQ17DRAFT_1242457 [Cyathus striatus]
MHIPHLVVIDGLDECNGTEEQSRIITTIGDILSNLPTHLQFLIASHPEWEICKALNSPSIKDSCVLLILDK